VVKLVQVSYPGVYIEEVPSGVHTITGVATSIAAFFGRTAKGPINKAVRCLSMSDFTRGFGGPHPDNDLAQSVRQFFDNGGTDCYIIRVAHNAERASVILKNQAENDVLEAVAKNAGNWGNAIYLEVDYNTPNPDDTFNLRVIHKVGDTLIASENFTNLSMDPASARYAPPFVTQSSKIIDLNGFGNEPSTDGYSESRRPFNRADLLDDLNLLVYTDQCSSFEISINDSPYININLGEDSTSFNETDNIEDQIEQRINTLLNDNPDTIGLIVDCTLSVVEESEDIVVLRITSDVDPHRSVRIRRAIRNDLTGPMMLGIDQGGIEVTRYSELRPVPTATMFTGNVNELAALTQNAVNQIQINGGASSLNLNDDLQTTGEHERWYRDDLPSEINGHNDGVREKLRIIQKAVNRATDLPCRAEVWGYHLAFIPTEGTINRTIEVTITVPDIETDTFFTQNVRQYALGAAGNSVYQQIPGTIGKDDDGINPLETGDYIGNEEQHTGFHALDRVDLFNLMVIPRDKDILGTDHQALYGQASIYCQQNRAFLLMDAPDSWTDVDRLVATSTEVNSLRSLVTKQNSAVFYPKVQYSDAGIKKYIGPSGMIAGLMARIDSTRGIWKAPAGIEADLRGILDVEVNLTDLENGVLNKLGVNCLRKFPSGIVNWGARTMSGSDSDTSEWKYIPIRRLALFLEESLYRGTKWVVFEPNDEPLWAKIRLNLGAFMMRLFRQGAFQGSTPDKAFYVKCDGETTIQADRNLGIVNIEVGFAPLKPAEFVIIRIQQIAGEL
jgi:phage tail sheath protein FI